MKVGGEVIYIDAKDERHKGVVSDVVGTGKSGYKTLDLTVAGETVKDVPHGYDEERGGYWYLAGEKPEVKAKPVAKKAKK